MLEPYYCKSGVIPNNGGWHYRQTMQDGSEQRIPHRNNYPDDRTLVTAVRLFRAQTGLPEGNVEFDVASYIRSISPPNDRFPGKQPNVEVPKYTPPIERLSNWLRAVIYKRPKLLHEAEADKRAEVCMSCAQNIQWRTGCLPCCEDVDLRGMHLRRRPIYKHDAKLNACRLHGIHLPSAIFLAREALPDLHPDSPAPCWLRQ